MWYAQVARGQLTPGHRPRPTSRRWFCMPALNEREDAGLTPTAFPMLSRLRSNLQHLQEALAVPLFNSLWQEAARGLSLFLYEEVGGCISDGTTRRVACLTRFCLVPSI